MADIIKIFNDIGQAYADEKERIFNDVYVKSIQKFLIIDLANYSHRLVDFEAVKDRLLTVSTSSKGGYLYPVYPINDKNGLKAVEKNMSDYLDGESLTKFQAFMKTIDQSRLEVLKQEVLAQIDPKEQMYVFMALCYQDRFFHEEGMYPEVYHHFIDRMGFDEKAVYVDAECFVSGKSTIGYDAGLNFCSTNELSDALARNTKFRLLPLSKESNIHVRLGFKRVFGYRDLKLNIFGLPYVMLPTILATDKRSLYDDVFELVHMNELGIEKQHLIESTIEALVEGLDESKSNRVLLSFLLVEEGNSKIVLKQTIEDVSLSRIAYANQLMYEKHIVAFHKLDRYTKKTAYQEKNLYIRNYIPNGLLLAKLLFGKEKLYSIDQFYQMLASRILHGEVGGTTRRRLSGIISGNAFSDGEIRYFSDDADFAKHERFIEFLRDIDAVGDAFKTITLGGDMQFETLDEMLEKKFNTVTFLIDNPKAQMFYIVGAFSKLVINWQYREKSTTVEKYIDSLGRVNESNIDRVFNKIHDGARKYTMYGERYNRLTKAYSDARSNSAFDDCKVSGDIANIAFVMGATDYRELPKTKQEEGENNE